MADKWTPEEAEAWANVADMEGEVSLLVESNDKLRAEIERLKAAVVEIGTAHIAAQTEVERLRAIIEKLIGLSEYSDPELADALRKSLDNSKEY
jgi:hypothetical protein